MWGQELQINTEQHISGRQVFNLVSKRQGMVPPFQRNRSKRCGEKGSVNYWSLKGAKETGLGEHSDRFSLFEAVFI
jgi:hypothetical protein